MPKTTIDLVDPELRPTMESLPTFKIGTETLTEVRAGILDLVPPTADYERDDVKMESLTIPGLEGGPDIGINIFTPVGGDDLKPAMLHIHGGGYIVGTADLGNVGNTRTASEVGCVVVSVDYQLSPEVTAPTAVKECYTALKWLHENADELGVDRSRIAIGGESAGGGLTANLALYARDCGEIDICFQLLIYPMLGDRTVIRSDGNPHVGEFGWTHDANAFGWTSLLGQSPGEEEVPPYSVAARATDLSNLPPAYMYVGSLDLFLEEDVEYAMRMLKAGVPVELHVLAGAYHGFEMAPKARVSIKAEQESRDALKRVFEK